MSQKTYPMSQKTYSWTLTALLMVGTIGCQVSKTEEGSLPKVDIDIQEGELPEYDVDAAEIDFGRLPEAAGDAAITAKVKAKLVADPEVNPFEIDVDTRNGVVRLSGKVESDGDRYEAVELATNTEGVAGVVDEITLGTKTLEETVEDSVITAKIKTKLAADPQVNPFTIDVDTEEGIVTLTGHVDKVEARTEAEKLSRDTDGVVGVNNLIAVESEV